MKIIDLTHKISPDMPVYPGTRTPSFKIACTLEQKGFVETELIFYSHTGTHMDSPAHIIPEGKPLDLFGTDYFYGPGLVLDVSTLGEIGLKHLTPFQAKLKQVSFAILYTGWDKYWGNDRYFEDFPVLTCEAANWLVSLGIKAVGVDAISVDQVEDNSSLPIHNILLGNNVLVVENLTNLREVVGGEIIFCCMPLKTYRSDGAPARAMAIIPE